MDVLLVEDDPSIAEPLRIGLEREGFRVQPVRTGREALDAPGADLVLLDLGLPDMDGYEVCRQLRVRSDVPIIVVTARGEEVDRVVGLELGADDYVVKPFGVRELVARMRAVTRRTARRSGVPDRTEVGPLVLDRRTRRVTVVGEPVGLTPTEFEMLAVLLEDPGAVVSRNTLLERVWGSRWYGASRMIDVHVASMRKKLRDPSLIETVRGIGFRFAVPS